jgi:hypothetical protein
MIMAVTGIAYGANIALNGGSGGNALEFGQGQVSTNWSAIPMVELQLFHTPDISMNHPLQENSLSTQSSLKMLMTLALVKILLSKSFQMRALKLFLSLRQKLPDRM